MTANDGTDGIFDRSSARKAVIAGVCLSLLGETNRDRGPAPAE